MSEKGFRLIYCKECKRKRHCRSVPIPGHNFRWTCSKGHRWVEVGVTLNRIISIMKDVITKERLTDIFERNDIFYSTLNREKR